MILFKIADKLLKLANNLDQKGLYSEATEVDKILKALAEEEEPKYLIKISKTEFMGTVTIFVSVTKIETGKDMESREFEGKMREIWPKVTRYVRELQNKYHPSKVEM